MRVLAVYFCQISIAENDRITFFLLLMISQHWCRHYFSNIHPNFVATWCHQPRWLPTYWYILPNISSITFCSSNCPRDDTQIHIYCYNQGNDTCWADCCVCDMLHVVMDNYLDYTNCNKWKYTNHEYHASKSAILQYFVPKLKVLMGNFYFEAICNCKQYGCEMESNTQLV